MLNNNINLVDINEYTVPYPQYMVLFQELETTSTTLDANFVFLNQLLYDKEKGNCFYHVLTIPLKTSGPQSGFSSSLNPLISNLTNSTTISSPLVTAGPIKMKKNTNTHLTFYAADESGQLSFLFFKDSPSSSSATLSVSSSTPTHSLNILQFVDLEKIRNISVCSTTNGILVVASQKASITYLTAWDSHYGTLQEQLELYDGSQLDTPDLNSTRYFTLVHHPHSSLKSGQLLLSTSSHSPNSKYIESSIQVIPYEAPATVSLLSALGKGNVNSTKKSIHSVIPIPPPPCSKKTKPLKAWSKKVDDWYELDRIYLEKLCDPLQTPSVEIFSTTFIEWISQQVSFIRGWPTSTSNDSTIAKVPHKVAKLKKGASIPKSLLHLPRLEMTQTTIVKLLNRTIHSPLSFWPRAVIEYLVAITGEKGNSVYGEKFVKTLFELNEVDLLQRIIPKLAVAELCLVIEWLSKADEKIFEVVSLTTYHHLFHITFSAIGIYDSRSPLPFLKNLSKSQIMTIFEWLKETLDPSSLPELSTRYDANGNVINQVPNLAPTKCPLWWAWYNEDVAEFPFLASSSSSQLEYERWITALDSFSMMIDAHLSLVKLDADLQCMVKNLSQIVKRDSYLLELFQRRLYGPLQGTVSQDAIEAFQSKGKQSRGSGRYGREWRKMVNQIELGVGEYAVEILEI